MSTNNSPVTGSPAVPERCKLAWTSRNLAGLSLLSFIGMVALAYAADTLEQVIISTWPALATLLCALLCGASVVILGLAALICSLAALRRIDKSSGLLTGRDQARLGLAGSLLPIVLLAIFIPNFIKSRTTSSINSCIFNQMWMQSAKAKWAEEKKRTTSDTPTEAEILEYMGKVAPMWGGRRRPVPVPDQLPSCFLSNRKLIIGTVGERVRCAEVEDHTWNDQLYRAHYPLGGK